MDCYKLVNGTLQPVDDPLDAVLDTAADFDESIRLAGYTVRVCSSRLDDGHGAEVAIYETAQPDRPRYYIDVMGTEQGIAVLVADDFPALLATLKELQPLTALIGLDQQGWIHVTNTLAREDAAKKGR